uniref:Uncharacterized protein n=1 Tax=Globodera rostochiensis TaxID=31243 RepID=A0A914HJW0_GLORO
MSLSTLSRPTGIEWVEVANCLCPQEGAGPCPTNNAPAGLNINLNPLLQRSTQVGGAGSGCVTSRFCGEEAEDF